MHFGEEGIIIPDLPEPITAYRIWDFGIFHSIVSPRELLSLNGSEWKVGVNEAICRRPNAVVYGYNHPRKDEFGPSCGTVPSPDDYGHTGYGCGIYGYKTLEDIAREWPQHGGHNSVIGKILMWGKTYEHTDGYRAQYAEAVEIYYGTKTTVRAIEYILTARRYGIRFAPLINEIEAQNTLLGVKETIAHAILSEAFYQSYRVATGKTDHMPSKWAKETTEFKFFESKQLPKGE